MIVIYLDYVHSTSVILLPFEFCYLCIVQFTLHKHVYCSNLIHLCRVQIVFMMNLILHSTNVCSMLQVWHSTSVVLCHHIIII